MCDCPKCTAEKKHREFVRELERKLENRKKNKKDFVINPLTGQKMKINGTFEPQVVGPLENRLLCKKCLIDDGFFTGGGSWAPDSCPKCGGTECVWFENLSWLQKKKALKIYEEMKKKRGY